MPFIGARYPVAAAIATETSGSQITYSAGFVLGKLCAANTNWESSDAELYGDDVLCESDNGITGGTISIETDDFTDANLATLLGKTVVTTGTDPNVVTTYVTTGDEAPYVGVGFIGVKSKAGVKSYIGYWYPKAQFKMNGEELSSKQKSVEFKTRSIEGKIFGTYPDNTGKAQFREEQVFSTFSAAQTWLKTKAGIT